MRIVNKSAPRNYTIEERLEAGIMLLGSEVKAVRAGHADLTGSHVKIIGSEAYLVNAKIFPYKFSRIENYDEARSRKLLLHKKELVALKSRLDQGKFTLVPTSLYMHNNLIKLEIALAKGKKQYEKKQDLKRRDLDRDAELDLKNIG